jgi:hypothetical protein
MHPPSGPPGSRRSRNPRRVEVVRQYLLRIGRITWRSSWLLPPPAESSERLRRERRCLAERQSISLVIDGGLAPVFPPQLDPRLGCRSPSMLSDSLTFPRSQTRRIHLVPYRSDTPTVPAVARFPRRLFSEFTPFACESSSKELESAGLGQSYRSVAAAGRSLPILPDRRPEYLSARRTCRVHRPSQCTCLRRVHLRDLERSRKHPQPRCDVPSTDARSRRRSSVPRTCCHDCGVPAWR